MVPISHFHFDTLLNGAHNVLIKVGIEKKNLSNFQLDEAKHTKKTTVDIKLNTHSCSLSLGLEIAF